MKKSIKKLLILFLAIAILLSSLFLFKSCSKKDNVENIIEESNTITEAIETKEEVKEETIVNEEIKVEEVKKDDSTYSYYVNFLNKDGSLLQRSIYKYGETPSFKGVTPEYSDNSYYYSFTGWDKKTSPVYGTQTYTALYDIVGTVEKSAVEFGPQYKYEINQLAKYLNIDGNKLQNLLITWVNDSSNRDKTYADLLDNIETKEDALCVTTIYILGIEHFVVSNSTINEVPCKDVVKAILNSDYIFKNIKQIFEVINNNVDDDEFYLNYLPSNILSAWNDEILEILGLKDVGVVPTEDIYDAFKYSIDHASEELAVENIYTITANAIYKIMHIADPDIEMELNDIKDSMNRMIAKSASETIFDGQIFTKFSSLTSSEQKQMAYDYAIYCYMCMFGLISGDPAYAALSNHFTQKEFTSLDCIGYSLSSDYLFKKIAIVINSVETKNSGNILYMCINYCLNDGTMLTDIMDKYTSDCNDMYKAIGEIFTYQTDN